MVLTEGLDQHPGDVNPAITKFQLKVYLPCVDLKYDATYIDILKVIPAVTIL